MKGAGKVKNRVLAAKQKRAERLRSGGEPDAEALLAGGWFTVDDSVHKAFAAAEEAELKKAAEAAQGPGARRRAAALGAGASGGWSAVAADSGALLSGATEGGFLTLEELAPELVFDAARLSGGAAARGKAAAQAAAAPKEASEEERPPKKARKEAKEAPPKPPVVKVKTAAAAPRGPTPPAPSDPNAQLSKTKRRRLLRKKQRDAPDSAGEAAAPARAAAPPQPPSEDGFVKPPSKKKRKRLALEAAAAATEAAAAPSRALPLSAVQAGWGSFGLHPLLLSGLAQLGFATPTPVQAATLPAALGEGCDVIGAAATGSGKTLAFGLPILDYCARALEASEGANQDGRLVALVLCPTRELALQVAAHLSAAGRAAGVRVAALVGGLAQAKQSRLLSQRPQVVVATPGRLWELASGGSGEGGGEQHLVEGLPSLRFLVLDEADRMVEKGHFAELERILDAVERGSAPAEAGAGADADAAPSAASAKEARQTFVFSATLTAAAAMRKRLSLKGAGAGGSAKRRDANSAVGQLLERVPFVRKPRVIDVGASAAAAAGKEGGKGAVAGLAPRLEEACIEGSNESRDAALVYLLQRYPGRTLVFCNAISCVRRVAALLALMRIPSTSIHASQQQRQRLKALDRFSAAGGEGDEGASLALVATDVAARGLDIPGVRTVIHYQVAPSADVYVHRSGRTARAHSAGLAVTLVVPAEQSRYLQLCRALGRPQGLPRFPLQPQPMQLCMRRAATATKLDELVHKREKRQGDVAWARRHAQELDLALSDDDEEDGEGGAKGGASEREKELRAKLDALLAQPLVRGEGGAAAGGSRKFPSFSAAAGPAAAPEKVGGGDALDAVLAAKAASKAKGKRKTMK